MSLIWRLVYYALLLYFFVMWARFVLDLVRVMNREWRPAGPWLVAAETVYVLTDPPIRLFRRILPPLRVGSVAFDFGWGITMLGVVIAMTAASWLS